MLLEEENELLRDNYMKAIKKLKVLYDSGRLVLTQQILEKFQHYVDEDRVLDVLGQNRRDGLD